MRKPSYKKIIRGKKTRNLNGLLSILIALKSNNHTILLISMRRSLSRQCRKACHLLLITCLLIRAMRLSLIVLLFFFSLCERARTQTQTQLIFSFTFDHNIDFYHCVQKQFMPNVDGQHTNRDERRKVAT